jgi:hypothetical protein
MDFFFVVFITLYLLLSGTWIYIFTLYYNVNISILSISSKGGGRITFMRGGQGNRVGREEAAHFFSRYTQ